jgi:hypothetical protein
MVRLVRMAQRVLSVRKRQTVPKVRRSVLSGLLDPWHRWLRRDQLDRPDHWDRLDRKARHWVQSDPLFLTVLLAPMAPKVHSVPLARSVLMARQTVLLGPLALSDQKPQAYPPRSPPAVLSDP